VSLMCCNHWQRSQKDFIEGLGEPWTKQKIKNAADHYRDEVLPAAAHLASKPAGYMGVKSHPMYSIPIHLWGSPILHDELGLVKDWLIRLEKFVDCQVEVVPTEEVATREHLVIRTNDLEDLLFATEEVQPKESIKELERHLARLEKEIKGRSRTCENLRTGQPTTIPGRVTQEEQRIVDQISWEITSWHETTKTIVEETKAAKEQIEKMAQQLKRMRDTRDLTEGSVEYAIDSTLCANGVDRKIGPQIQKLLANRVTILSQLEANFMRVREQTLERDATINLASREEIKEEMAFFGQILHCYDCVFGLLSQTRTIFSTEERTELQGAIEILKSVWPTQRIWEKKAASVTPKSHDLWFEI
jgi:hypothetical protein